LEFFSNLRAFSANQFMLKVWKIVYQIHMKISRSQLVTERNCYDLIGLLIFKYQKRIKILKSRGIFYRRKGNGEHDGIFWIRKNIG